MPDPLFQWVYDAAESLGAPAAPSWLNDVEVCLGLVNTVQEKVIPAIHQDPSEQRVRECFAALASEPTSVPGVAEAAWRMNILLRLWCGCLGAAKTIAAATMDGPNVAADRARIFSESLDPLAAADPVFRAGVRTAPTFKHRQQPPQPYYLDGVPEGSVVREVTPGS